MKTKVKKSEIRECVKDALIRIVEESYDREENTEKWEKNKNFKKKSPKHGKMGPVKNDKYKNSWKNDY